MTPKNITDFLHFTRPTVEQETVLKAMVDFIKETDPYDFMILTGAAGTGKTSLTAALIGYLNDRERPYYICAPTGRAARILGRKANTTASTIHHMIYKPETNEKSGTVHFRLKKIVNETPVIYIIDEASMIASEADQADPVFKVDKGLVYDLFAFIKGANVHNKVILLGDHYQLPPVGENESRALNREFLEVNFNLKGTAFELTEVKRQEDGSYILENAVEIRNAIKSKGSGNLIKGEKSRNIYDAADKYVKRLKSQGPEKTVTISVSNNANNFFNKLVRERTFKNASKILEPGDLLMVTRNWYRNGQQLYNGDHVILETADWNLQEQVAGLHFIAVRIKLLFSEEEKIIEDYALLESIITPGGKIDSRLENELRHQRYVKNKIFRESGMPGDDRYVGALRLVYGHAITCNKAQGGEWQKVFINNWGIPSLKWQYTAVTRGIDELESFG